MAADMPIRQAIHFLGQAATHFRQTGAIMPSGRRLSRELAAAVGQVPPGGVIVELGPGSGAVTEALRRLHPQAVVLAIENNPAFANRLSERLPAVHVVHGCASAIPAHVRRIGRQHHEVAAVVSGLPLLSLPPELVGRILDAVREVLAPGRRFVQFTYSAKAFRRLTPAGFTAERHRRVWLNVPPAVVMPFTRSDAA